MMFPHAGACCSCLSVCLSVVLCSLSDFLLCHPRGARRVTWLLTTGLCSIHFNPFHIVTFYFCVVFLIHFNIIFPSSPVGGIVTRLWAGGSMFDSRRGKRCFSSARLPDRMWGSSFFRYSGYWGLFPRWSSGWNLNFTAHSSHLVLRSWVEIYMYCRCIRLWHEQGNPYVYIHVQISHLLPFLGTFAKLRKATVSFVMSVRPSVRPHGTTLLPLDGFWWNLIHMDFSKLCRENSSFIKIREE